jgi:hypothetical protein
MQTVSANTGVPARSGIPSIPATLLFAARSEVTDAQPLDPRIATCERGSGLFTCHPHRNMILLWKAPTVAAIPFPLVAASRSPSRPPEPHSLQAYGFGGLFYFLHACSEKADLRI